MGLSQLAGCFDFYAAASYPQSFSFTNPEHIGLQDMATWRRRLSRSEVTDTCPPTLTAPASYIVEARNELNQTDFSDPPLKNPDDLTRLNAEVDAF